MSIRYYGLVTKDKKIETECEKFQTMRDLGLQNVSYEILKGTDDIRWYYELANRSRHRKEFEADGIVITVNSIEKQEEMGRDPSNNPKFSIAMKYPYPIETTKLKSIEWSMGKVGTITPVAKVEPVDLGVTVENISLANLDTMTKLWGLNYSPRVGDVVEVYRSGDVIPVIRKIVERNHSGKKLLRPSKCPTCKSKTIIDGPFLTCRNANCDSRKIGDLCKWANKIKEHFKVKGLGPERIEQMFEAELIEDISDLYRLSDGDLIGVIPGVKEKSAANILAFQKYNNIPLSIFLGGLNIPGVGESIFKFIIGAGYDSLEKILDMREDDIAKVNGLGSVRAKLMVEWLEKKRELISELLDFVTIKKEENKDLNSNVLNGDSFCFTGKLSNSRSHFEDMVKQNGGVIKSVSQNLNYLVIGMKAGSKLEKAEKYGTTILTEKEFLDMVGD
jgi:DNA ligase (NAD+)